LLLVDPFFIFLAARASAGLPRDDGGGAGQQVGEQVPFFPHFRGAEVALRLGRRRGLAQLRGLLAGRALQLATGALERRL
jgi:hypothetical protein